MTASKPIHVQLQDIRAIIKYDKLTILFHGDTIGTRQIGSKRINHRHLMYVRRSE